jgi:acetylornithine deacetylase/succinyl-diaminopimelate desuccinylase-like protein
MMIFVPSVNGISHNPAEHTAPEHLAAGANVLLHPAGPCCELPDCRQRPRRGLTPIHP